MGIKICEVIPFKGFKEKIRLTKKYKNYKIEVYENYILVLGGAD